MRERRGYIRTNTSVRLSVNLEDKAAAKTVIAVTRNISATGLLIETDESLPIGSNVSIDIDTPKANNPIHCTGKVVWAAPIANSEKFNLGIELMDIEEDNKNTFLKFLCDTIYNSIE